MLDVDDAELSDRHTTILEWIDTFCVDPGGLTDDLRRRMLEQFSQHTILEAAVYSMIGLCYSKAMITLGLEFNAGDTVGHGPNRDVDPYTNSIEIAYTTGQRSEAELLADGGGSVQEALNEHA